MDAILALAEINEYKANPNRLATGVVLESNLDKGFGPTATVIVKNGTLAKGDFIICGKTYGRIRSMFSDTSKEVQIAYPSQPVKITGLNEVPAAGDHFMVSNDEKVIKELAKKIKTKLADLRFSLNSHATAEDDGKKHLNIVLKTDVHGSLEAIKSMLAKIAVEGTMLNIIHSAIGGITESDVQLAKASNAIIVGFNIKPLRAIRDIAESQGVKILFYNIIYKLNEDVAAMLVGKLDPIYEEVETAEAEVLQV